MVVVIIDYIGITINKFKEDSPVAGYFNGVLVFFVSHQFMKIRARVIHVFYIIRCIKTVKNPFYSISMLRLYAFFLAGIEKLFKAF
jgi:hypothetical protein